MMMMIWEGVSKYVALSVSAITASTKGSHDAHVRLSRSTVTAACRQYISHPPPYGLSYIPSQKHLRTIPLFSHNRQFRSSLTASQPKPCNEHLFLRSDVQSFPLWHKNNPSQSFYILFQFMTHATVK